MAYENVTPPPLPEYDSTIYRYYLLVFNFDEGNTEWYQVHLLYAESPFVYDSDKKCINGSVATYGGQVYDVYDAWAILLGQEFHTIGLELNLTPGLDGEVFQRIYTNHDILDSKGNVYLAADCVTPIYTFDLRSWLIGYTLGICGKPLPLTNGGKKEPIAYLCNGVEVPVFPEWDKEKYPYAMLTSNAYGDVCGLYLFVATEPIYLVSSYITMVRLRNGGEYIKSEININEGDNSWTVGTPTNCTATDNIESFSQASFNVIWANTDVLWNDGTVCLEDSEITPVYREVAKCSYNGTVLPALPEWDKEAYPYAVICPFYDAGYVMACYSEPISVGGITYVPHIRCSTGDAMNIWVGPMTTSRSDYDPGDAIWSNYDIMKNGTVYLKASDPIPVNE